MRLKAKLRSQRGETLVETLSAMLVIVFASMCLFFAIMTAARINNAVAAADDNYSTELNAAEDFTTATQDDDGDDGKVTITPSSGGFITIDVSISGTAGELRAYERSDD